MSGEKNSNTQFVTKRPRNKRKFILLGIVAVIALVGGGFWFFNGKETDGSPQINWIQVDQGAVQKKVSLSGTLNPANQATLTHSGKVTYVYVKTGQKVKQGQEIAKMDTKQLEIELKVAKAQLEQTEEQLDNFTTNSDSTQSNAQGESNTSETQLEVEITKAQGEVDSLQEQINDSTIKSPFNGTVLQVIDPKSTSSTTSSEQTSNNQEEGGNTNNTSSNSGNTIAVIANLDADQFMVEANVSQSDIANIKAEQKAEITLSSNSSKLTGSVQEVSLLPETDSGVTTYPITITVDSPSNTKTKLFPGTSVDVDIVEQSAKQVLRLPTAAITQQKDQVGVYVKNTNGTKTDTNDNANKALAELTFQPITVGLYGENYVEIKKGLTKGDAVAIVTNISKDQETSDQNRNGNGIGNLFGGGGSQRGPGGNTPGGNSPPQRDSQGGGRQ